ncbi:uroporphyrinogen decarboxylase [Thalassospira sp.]|uniref:uroporphyrinogen decarboxylase n=1 Tax=Thalassospira sp. TaxID=1912094 RepID=UPI002734E79B|nr:uroporphyrinogen decarboxylase [Thalassospira sp.]MDP2699258.1 uroporphyrinogen decarboxylase [Thalassospira sp.]
MPSEQKRFLRALAGETLAIPPIWLMRQAGRYLPEYRATRTEAGSFLDLCYNPKLACEVTLQPLRRYDFDAAILFSDILVIPQALGQELAFKQGEGPQLDPIRDASGLSRLNIDKIHETLGPVYETVSLLSDAIPAHTALIGFAGAPWTVATYMVEGKGSKDFANIRRFAYGDPEGFSKLIDILVEATTQYLLRQVAAGAECIQLFETWGGVLSENGFHRWVIEPTRRIVANLKAVHPDVPVIGFPRGAGLHLIDFKTLTGVDAVGLDSGVPLKWVAENLQKLGPVQGNLDPMYLITGGDEMLAEVRRILDVLGNGPFIFNLGHGITPETPPENVGLLVDYIRAQK